MQTDTQAGGGARDVHARLEAARLRRLKADGATDEELLAALDSGPAHERAWIIGADGEQAVGLVLNEWSAVCGFGVLHDLTIPGRRSNIDHVTVGSGGVTVVDTKTWTGPVKFTRSGLRVGRYGKRKDIAAVADQVAVVREALLAAGVAVPVAGVLCLANRNLGRDPVTLHHIDAIGVGTPEAVAAAVSQGSACIRTAAERAYVVLAAHFAHREGLPVGNLIERSPVPTHFVTPAWSTAPARPLPVIRRRAPRAMAGFATRPARWLVAAAIVAVTLSVALQHRPADSERLDGKGLLALRGDLEARAVAAAGGAVRGPRITITTERVHLRYRRGRCRVHVSLNRSTARGAEDAVLIASRACLH
ncbi:MAG: hypothetical protein JWR63_1892 [Conexibacter sp.]|nr:hypothetical protein [Conexibacter sp.]